MSRFFIIYIIYVVGLAQGEQVHALECNLVPRGYQRLFFSGAARYIVVGRHKFRAEKLPEVKPLVLHGKYKQLSETRSPNRKRHKKTLWHLELYFSW